MGGTEQKKENTKRILPAPQKRQKGLWPTQKKIPAKMEQVAREKYNMKREGETVIEVEEE